MLRLPHKSGHKRRIFWLKICGYSAGVHVILLIALFLGYKSTTSLHFSISSRIIPPGVPVVLVSHIKRLGNPIPNLSATGSSKNTATEIANDPKIEVIAPTKINAPRAATSLVNAPVIAKKSTQKNSKKPLGVLSKKKATQRKKTAPQKSLDKKKIEPLKKVIEKTPSKTTKTPAKNIEPKEPPKMVETLKEVVQSASLQTDTSISALGDSLQVASDAQQGTMQDVLYVGRQEWEQMQRQTELQESMIEVWQPPLGLSDDLSCEIQVVFDLQGAIKAIVMYKASGSSMFDMSARQAVYSLKVPQWAYGKEVIIAFTQ